MEKQTKKMNTKKSSFVSSTPVITSKNTNSSLFSSASGFGSTIISSNSNNNLSLIELENLLRKRGSISEFINLSNVASSSGIISLNNPNIDLFKGLGLLKQGSFGNDFTDLGRELLGYLKGKNEGNSFQTTGWRPQV